jgi:hypothetical protein
VGLTLGWQKRQREGDWLDVLAASFGGAVAGGLIGMPLAFAVGGIVVLVT